MTTKPKKFTTGPLYKKLVEVLPAYVEDPFGEKPKLNVGKLRDAADMSSEGIYKWLRRSRLSPHAVDKLVELGNKANNLRVLTTLERTPPTREDFLGFVFTNA